MSIVEQYFNILYNMWQRGLSPIWQQAKWQISIFFYFTPQAHQFKFVCIEIKKQVSIGSLSLCRHWHSSLWREKQKRITGVNGLRVFICNGNIKTITRAQMYMKLILFCLIETWLNSQKNSLLVIFIKFLIIFN